MPYKKIHLLVLPLILVAACEPEKPNQPYSGVPVLTTLAVTNITTTSAISGGNITDDGGFTITARGVCWSTSENPTVNDEKTVDETSSSNFTCQISELNSNTTYIIRAYVTNLTGTGYGNEITFTTKAGGTFTDIRDGRVYNYVIIGNQFWMEENLAYLPKVSQPSVKSFTEPMYYVNGFYNSSLNEAKATNNYKIYGVLYNWPAAMNGASSSSSNPSGVQGLCPDGWHLPSGEEWIELIDYLGGESVAGDKLKATKGWKYEGNGSNSSGFTALPAGSCDYSTSSFGAMEYCGYWWSTTEFDAKNAWMNYINCYDTKAAYVNTSKSIGKSVRCIRDN
jgi:uncharacterized protein (TIGR02145 family)